MSDSFRYRYGETNPVQIANKAGVALAIGDLSYRDATDGYTLKPASSLAWAGSLALTQAAFAPLFVGVNEQRWDGTNLPTGSKDGLQRVSTTGVYEFDCAAGSNFNVGDDVAPDAAGNVLLPQQVIKTTVAGSSIGKVERSVTNASKVLVRLMSQIFAPPALSL